MRSACDRKPAGVGAGVVFRLHPLGVAQPRRALPHEAGLVRHPRPAGGRPGRDPRPSRRSGRAHVRSRRHRRGHCGVTAAIVNPSAGSGTARRRWPGAARMLAERLGPVKACFTEGPGHATTLARELADAGCDLLIVAGGDGTLNEVVNGVLMGSSDARVGVLPLASGGDFARTLGLTGLAPAVDALAAGDSRRIDAFRARFRSPGGVAAERCFLNAASFGLGAVAALGVRGWCRAVPGGARYLAAAIPTLASGRSFQVTLCLDDSVPLAFDID